MMLAYARLIVPESRSCECAVAGPDDPEDNMVEPVARPDPGIRTADV
jgi:hypothetical protein